MMFVVPTASTTVGIESEGLWLVARQITETDFVPTYAFAPATASTIDQDIDSSLPLASCLTGQPQRLLTSKAKKAVDIAWLLA